MSIGKISMQTNYLNPTSFLVSVKRLPNVVFFTQRAILPSVSMSAVTTPTPLKNIYNVPDHLEYAELDLSFIIDEDMNNYLEILRWMEGIATPEKLSQYDRLQKSEEGIRSDIVVVLTNSAKNPHIEIRYKDAFPLTISPISLDITPSDVQYPEATVTFRHNGFEITQL